jgi:hypothetical protein
MAATTTVVRMECERTWGCSRPGIACQLGQGRFIQSQAGCEIRPQGTREVQSATRPILKQQRDDRYQLANAKGTITLGGVRRQISARCIEALDASASKSDGDDVAVIGGAQ